jgi:hypothetical protein
MYNSAEAFYFCLIKDANYVKINYILYMSVFPELKFIIDREYDLEMVRWKFQECPGVPETIVNRTGISLELVERILKSRDGEGRELIEKLVNQRYEALLPYLKNPLRLYQESWDEINANFFEWTEETTGYHWEHEIYFCVLSPFHKGISSWGGNKIVRTWKENPYYMRKITAHELLISHLFTIFRRDFKKEELTNREKWALSEISAFAITGLEKRMLGLWPWVSEEQRYPLNHNYPELYELQRMLRPAYDKKKDFKNFLEEAVRTISSRRRL